MLRNCGQSRAERERRSTPLTESWTATAAARESRRIPTHDDRHADEKTRPPYSTTSIGIGRRLPTGDNDRERHAVSASDAARGRSVSSAERRIGHRKLRGYRVACVARYTARARSRRRPGESMIGQIEIMPGAVTARSRSRRGRAATTRNAKAVRLYRRPKVRQSAGRAKPVSAMTFAGSMPTASKPLLARRAGIRATTKNRPVGVRSVVSRFSTIGMSPPPEAPRRPPVTRRGAIRS